MILSYGEVIFEITNFKDEDLVTPKEGEREIGICGKLNQKVPGWKVIIIEWGKTCLILFLAIVIIQHWNSPPLHYSSLRASETSIKTYLLV